MRLKLTTIILKINEINASNIDGFKNTLKLIVVFECESRLQIKPISKTNNRRSKRYIKTV